MVCDSRALYPMTGIVELRRQRGEQWAELVDWIADLPVTAPEAMAFTLTVRRLRSYLFPADEGERHDLYCAQCATRLVKAFEGTEEELLAVYYNNLQEIYSALNVMQLSTRRRHIA